MHQFIQNIQAQLQLYNVLSDVIQAVNKGANEVLSAYDAKDMSCKRKKVAIGSILHSVESMVNAHQPHVAALSMGEYKGSLIRQNIVNCYVALGNYGNKLRYHLAQLSLLVQETLSQSPIHQMLLLIQQHLQEFPQDL